ncbi:hypothetical protein DY000_02030186 [Brassica cretica]|uniref:Myosin motor domain-containing protein n=1 Tax=Brassica cretica TaxID=69181 RepID=A0ABQ7DKG4_BRACR|nr:hypothetical protein DY000_02030186 [Brassica cretica]
MVQETENSSGAIGAMLSADAATDCGLRRRMYEETSPEEMNVHMSIRTVPSFLGETDENIFEEICKVLQKQECVKGIVSGIFFVVSFFVLFASYAAILYVRFNIPSNNDLNSALLFFSVQTLSLAGESGTGKPTVIELLWKFYNPDEVITFDGFESAGMATAATRYGEPRTSSVL